MTIFDPSRAEAAHQMFPELTKTQCGIALHFAAGYSVKEIAYQHNLAPSTINNTLSRVKDKFELQTIGDIRYVVMLRLILRGLY